MTGNRRKRKNSRPTAIYMLLLIAFSSSLMAQRTDTVLLPVRDLRIAIHVFRDDSGQGNFSQGSPGQEEFLFHLVDWANHRLAHLESLKPVVSSPFIGDCRVQISLDTIFYHNDSYAWDCSAEIDAPYMRDEYVDQDSSLNYRQKYQTLPVFIGANNPVTGGHSRNIGDRGYIAVRGYFENFLRQDAPSALDECGRNLIHELGHCLGLSHNFTGGPGGDQCDNCEDNGCPLEGTSNNIMDYWPSYGYALSRCQFDLIHFYLDGGSGNISEVVINDSCYRVPGITLSISAGSTMEITDTVYVHSDLRVESGGSLLVTGYLSMPGDTEILVESGGQLTIDGGTIGNLCGDLWSGIRIHGTPGSVKPVVRVINHGLIEHAQTGIAATGPVETRFKDSEWRNCVESIVLSGGASDTVVIEDCSFIITTRLNHYEEGITPMGFIRTEGVSRLDIRGCRLVNEPGTFIFDADWMGTGIHADCPSVHIENSEITSLTKGLVLNSGDPGSKFEVVSNIFRDNRYGMVTQYSGIQWISNNRFYLQRFNTGNTVGLFLVGPDRFVAKDNRMESLYGGGLLTGMVISHPTPETSPVFRNEFSNLTVAIFMDGIPGIDSGLFEWAESRDSLESLKVGPQFRNNRFDSVTMQFAQVADSSFGSAIGNIEDVQPEYTLKATQWTPGGFGWYNERLNMVAFWGWEPSLLKEPDRGLYWFMNYLSISNSEAYFDRFPDIGPVKDYLLKLAETEKSANRIFGAGVNDALEWVSNVPAALRSSGGAANWEKFRAEDQTWLRQSLAITAGNFVRDDSLMTALGTSLAQSNMDQWEEYEVLVRGEEYNAASLNESPEFSLPDLTSFRFQRPPEFKGEPPAFILYPNPVTDYLFIEPRAGFSFETPWYGKIFSLEGRQMRTFRIASWEDRKLAVSQFAAGVYLIEIFSGNQYLGTAKFVKTTHN